MGCLGLILTIVYVGFLLTNPLATLAATIVVAIVYVPLRLTWVILGKIPWSALVVLWIGLLVLLATAISELSPGK